MRTTRQALILGALALLPVPALSQEASWAVVVGIDDYTHLHGVEGGDLLGAEHDAQGFVDYLVRGQGLPEDHLMVLLGADATGAAIRGALSEWLPARVGPRDRVYVFFSGHGSQVLDRNGDEDDGLDETLAPVDVLPYSSAHDIVDDELDALLSALTAQEIVVILDSCSSGTATKVAGIEGRPRRLERRVARAKGMGADTLGSGFVDGGTSRVVELAASAPYQTALDAAFLGDDGEVAFYGGAFTTYLLERLWAAADTATLLSVLTGTRQDLRDHRFLQEPQYAGPERAPVKAQRPGGGPQPK